MRTSRLGRTGLQVPIVGIGTAFLGYGAPEDAASGNFTTDDEGGKEALRTAIRGGASFIDTSPYYGVTGAEKLVGAVLREPGFRAAAQVMTKAGRLREGKDYSRDAIRASVLNSLADLGLEKLDIVAVHDAQGHPPEEVLGKGGALQALRELKSEGLIGAIGIACSQPEVNAGYIETGEFDVALVADAWSMLTQDPIMLDRILPAAEKHDIGIIIATPLERGLLATGPIPGRPYQSRQFSPEVIEHVGKIQALCARHGITLLAAALQWLTRHPRVASAVPGARNPAEAKANAEAGSLAIPEAFWEELKPMIRHWAVDRSKRIIYKR
jgi:D-threo-aldose 1-dehydrogenase